jgi:hypothetical protein
VRIPRDCENLAMRVPAPRITKAVNPKLATALALGALDQANGNLDDTRGCQERQRKRFARGT